MLVPDKAACRATGSLFFCLFLVACAATPQSDRLRNQLPEPLSSPVELTEVPFYPQQEYQCGPAALATLIAAQQGQVDMAQLVRQVYIPQRQGSLQLEMIAAARTHQLIPYVIQPSLETLLNEVKAGRPVLVLQNLGVSWYPKWHYAVVVGFDLTQGRVILRSGTIKRYDLSIYTFEHTWRRSEYWAMVLLKPGELPVNGDDVRFMSALAGFEQAQAWSVLEPTYQRALQRWPRSRDLLMGQGNSQYLQGRLAEALTDYLKVIELYPKYAPAYNNAAQVYADRSEFDMALHYVKKAVSLGGVHSAQFESTLKEIIARQTIAKRTITSE